MRTVWILLVLLGLSEAFVAPLVKKCPTSALFMAKKGAKKRKKKGFQPADRASEAAKQEAPKEIELAPPQEIKLASSRIETSSKDEISFDNLTAGQQELQKMREARAEKDAEKSAKVDMYVQEREEIRNNPRAGVIPDSVSKRMLGRMVPLFSIPFVLGIGAFVAFYFYGQKTGNQLQPSIVAYSTQAPFFLGLLGLSYGVLSASWDEDEEGSFIGIEEFKTNTGRIFDGLKRASERRDLEEEIQAREEALRKKKD